MTRGLSKLEWMKKLRGSDLTNAERNVLLMVFTYTDQHGRGAFPGIRRLVTDTGISEKYLKSCLRRLVAEGWLAVQAPGGNQFGRGTATTYALGAGPRKPQTVENEDCPDNGDAKRGTQLPARGELSTPGEELGDPPSDDLSDYSNSSERGRSGAAAAARDLSAQSLDEEDLEALLEVVEASVGGFHEYTDEGTASSMISAGYHPYAVINTIERRRRG